MKVLLDECLPVDFRHHLVGHEVHTVEWAGFKALRNGKLLNEAERAGYHLFLTVDRGIPHQQDQRRRDLSILIIRTRTNQLEDLLPALASIVEVLETIQPGEVAFAP